MNIGTHKPVLLKEVIESLAIKPQGIYIDGTLGRCGHTREILKGLHEQGRLFAFDKDSDAIAAIPEDLKKDKRFSYFHHSFTKMKEIAISQGILGKVDGILLDLGVSSPQLDEAERGFSFLKEGPLDMRMDTSHGRSAAQWLQEAEEKEIADVLFEYGEERFARLIARAIIREREISPITTTQRLAEIAKTANPRWEKTKHPATRTFQAIRIYINNELLELQEVLPQCLEILAPGGRLVVISFHSLEDRIVKRFIRKEEKGEFVPKKIAMIVSDHHAKLKAISKAIKASELEVKENPRARSAILRVAEKQP